MRTTLKNLTTALSLVILLSSCSMAYRPPIAAPPQLAEHTMSGDILTALPPAKRKAVISVYEFQDQTGQMKPEDTFAEYSRAVTQGGISILNKALLDAGHKGWFTVIERGGLKNLIQERQIIKITRNEYKAPGQTTVQDVKPMLFAGIILEGGIVAYESNITTGGLGAKYLGVGGDVQYRRDIVTVYLRAVSTQTGEILTSVNTSKTIYSTAVDASIFKYVSFDKLLELETGFTANEPPQFAVRQAIEMGVYALIMEGAMDGLWEFKDPEAGKRAIAEYLERKGEAPAASQNPQREPVAYHAPENQTVAVQAPESAPMLTPPVTLRAPVTQPYASAPQPALNPITASEPVYTPAPVAAAQTNTTPITSSPVVLTPPAASSQAFSQPVYTNNAQLDASTVNLTQPMQPSTRAGRPLSDNVYSGMRANTKKCLDSTNADCVM